jgi:hypothetical protein
MPAGSLGQDLDLDVADAGEVLLDVHRAVAEGRLGLARGGVEVAFELGFGLDDAHAAPAAAGHRLQDHRIAEAGRDLARRGGRWHRAAGAGGDRHARGDRDRARRGLVAHLGDDVAARADEGDAFSLAAVREGGVLGEEAVTRMDRVRAQRLGRGDHRVGAQVAVARSRRPDAEREVGVLHCHRITVGLGIDLRRLDAELAAGALDAHRDLAAVGDEHAPDRVGGRHASRPQAGVMTNRSWPNSTASPSPARISLTVPAVSAVMAFISFMTSMMQSWSPAFTCWPSSTKGFAPGSAAR